MLQKPKKPIHGSPRSGKSSHRGKMRNMRSQTLSDELRTDIVWRGRTTDRIIIKRTGSCRKCGYCCPKNCEHFVDGLCATHNSKPAECIKAPEFPNRKWNPDCGFRFFTTTVDGDLLEVFAMQCGQPSDE